MRLWMKIFDSVSSFFGFPFTTDELLRIFDRIRITVSVSVIFIVIIIDFFTMLAFLTIYYSNLISVRLLNIFI